MSLWDTLPSDDEAADATGLGISIAVDSSSQFDTVGSDNDVNVNLP